LFHVTGKILTWPMRSVRIVAPFVHFAGLCG